MSLGEKGTSKILFCSLTGDFEFVLPATKF